MCHSCHANAGNDCNRRQQRIVILTTTEACCRPPTLASHCYPLGNVQAARSRLRRIKLSVVSPVRPAHLTTDLYCWRRGSWTITHNCSPSFLLQSNSWPCSRSPDRAWHLFSGHAVSSWQHQYCPTYYDYCVFRLLLWLSQLPPHPFQQTIHPPVHCSYPSSTMQDLPCVPLQKILKHHPAPLHTGSSSQSCCV